MPESPNPIQSQNPSQIYLEPVEVIYEATSKSKTYHVEMLFSIRRRRFIKPILKKHLKLWYSVLEGVYIKLASSGSRFAREREAILMLVKLGRDSGGRVFEDIISSAKIVASSNSDENDFSIVDDNEIIKDFLEAVPPSYHSYPAINYDKIYSEDDVRYLMNIINNQKIIYLYKVEE